LLFFEDIHNSGTYAFNIASSARRVSSLEPEELRAGGHGIGDDVGSARDGWQDFENDSVR